MSESSRPLEHGIRTGKSCTQYSRYVEISHFRRARLCSTQHTIQLGLSVLTKGSDRACYQFSGFQTHSRIDGSFAGHELACTTALGLAAATSSWVYE